MWRGCECGGVKGYTGIGANMEEIGKERKKYFKKGVDVTEDKKRRRTANAVIRRQDRERFCSLKRQQFLLNCEQLSSSSSSPNSSQIEYSVDEVHNASEKLSLVLGGLLSLRSPPECPGLKGDAHLISKIKCVSSPKFIHLISEGSKIAEEYKNKLINSRFAVALLEDCKNMTDCLVQALEIGLESYVLASGQPTEIQLAIEKFLLQVILSLGCTASSESDVSDESGCEENLTAKIYSPILSLLFAICVANFDQKYPFKTVLRESIRRTILGHCTDTAGHTQQSGEFDIDIPVFSDPFGLAQVIGTVVGNLAADCPIKVLEMRPIVPKSASCGSESCGMSGPSSGTLSHNMGTLDATGVDGDEYLDVFGSPMGILSTCAVCLHFVGNVLDECDASLEELQKLQDTALESKVVSLGHTVLWLLSNLLRLREPLLSEISFFHFDALRPFASIFNFCARNSRTCTTGDTSGNRLEIPSFLPSRNSCIFDLPTGHHLRVLLCESLWCLNYCCVSIPRLFNRIFTSFPFQATDIIGGLQVFVSSGIQMLPNNYFDSTLTRESSCEFENTELCSTDTPRSPSTVYGVDIISPAVQLLNLAALSSVPKLKDQSPDGYTTQSNDLNTTAVDLIIQKTGFQDVISKLLCHPHRGITRDTAELASTIASTNITRHVDFVFQLLPQLVCGLHYAAAFDIKREFASALYYVALGDHHRYLPNVLLANPNVLDSFVDLLSTCKYDTTTICVGLDFVEGVLRCFPEGRRILYEKNFIKAAERVQAVHSGPVTRRISQILATYFDDIDDLDCDEFVENAFRIDETINHQINPLNTEN